MGQQSKIFVDIINGSPLHVVLSQRVATPVSSSLSGMRNWPCLLDKQSPPEPYKCDNKSNKWHCHFLININYVSACRLLAHSLETRRIDTQCQLGKCKSKLAIINRGSYGQNNGSGQDTLPLLCPILSVTLPDRPLHANAKLGWPRSETGNRHASWVNPFALSTGGWTKPESTLL